MIICAVRDRAVDAYMRPFVVPHVGQAVRSFGDEVNTPNTPLNAHPEDYDLYVLGSFDETSGAVAGEQPRMIVSGKECVKTPS